jgi:hypothetical protein
MNTDQAVVDTDMNTDQAVVDTDMNIACDAKIINTTKDRNFDLKKTSQHSQRIDHTDL